jgi:hypothetical protein
MNLPSWVREHIVDDNPDQTEKSTLDRLDEAKDGAK